MREHHQIVVVGSGFAGLGMGVALKREGIEDFVILERAESLGGTWRENHYPGCGCDVPTPLYSFSFAPNPYWSRFYAKAEEIRAYLEHVADRFDLRHHIRFGADLTGGHWDEQRTRWVGEINGESGYEADFVIGGFGGLNRPAFPDIPGLEDFGGPLFHSAAWDHSVALKGRRVGVIGTGASAIQLVPQVARETEVIVFQRTPPWVVPKLDRAIPAWEQELYARVPVLQRAVRAGVFAVTEGVGLAITQAPALMRIGEAWSRRHMRRAIADPELRARLTPDYRLGCKRILPSNDWYEALARPNVSLVTDGIERVEPGRVITRDGSAHELDVLVCSTGFRIEEVFSRMEICGRGGRYLNQVWAGGLEAHRGTTVAGFPNLAILSGPNTGTGSTSQVFMIEAQIHYVIELLRALRRSGSAAIDVRPEAQAAYNRWLQRRMQRTVWLRGGCKSWYLDERGVNTTLYPGPSSEFWRSLRHVRPEEYELIPATAPASTPVPAPVLA